MTSTIPDALPFLSAGGHTSAADGACAMEYLSILAGEQFSDTPTCTDLQLGYMVQTVNDMVSDGARQRLLGFLHKVLGTNVFTIREAAGNAPDGTQYEDAYTHELADMKEYALFWRDLANAVIETLHYGDQLGAHSFQTYLAATTNYASGKYIMAVSNYHEAAKSFLLGGRRPNSSDPLEQASYDQRLLRRLEFVIDKFRERAGIEDAKPIDLAALEAKRQEVVAAL